MFFSPVIADYYVLVDCLQRDDLVQRFNYIILHIPTLQLNRDWSVCAIRISSA